MSSWMSTWFWLNTLKMKNIKYINRENVILIGTFSKLKGRQVNGQQKMYASVCKWPTEDVCKCM